MATAAVKKYRYADIENIHKNDDSTIVVTGCASSGEVDSDGEVITPEAMKAAIPDYMKFGAVREMHGKSAAGTALEIEVQDDGRTLFSALIVDPVAIKKVETGVYKGFSIGGKVKSRDDVNKTIITGLNLIEVSLVDRPANPEALITMYKADDADKTEVEAEAPKAEVETQKSEIEIAEGEPEPIQIQVHALDGESVKAFLIENADSISKAIKDSIGKAVSFAFVDAVAKAGAKFSASHKADLAALHKMASDMCDKFDGIGYKDADETEEKSEVVDVTKSEGADISKALDIANTELTKAQETIGDLNKSLSTAQKEIKLLKAQPAPPKASLKAVEKGDDVTGASQREEVNPHKPGTQEYALHVMKSVHRNGLTKA